MYIIIAIIAFGLLIAVHEFGHFSAAKLLGIKVNEFSIGMGPAILKRQRGETFYALRCLPIGGYCAMEGEDEETDDPRAFTRQPGWKRLIVLCAGSFMNFILGFLLVLVVYVQAAGFYSPVIDSFAEGCPYEGGQALMAGDEIYSVDGHRTWFMGNVSTFLSRGDGVYDIVVIRDGEKVELKDFELVPVEYEGGMSYGLVFAVEPATFGSVLRNTWYSTMDCVRIVWLSLSDLVAGAVGLDQLTGHGDGRRAGIRRGDDGDRLSGGLHRRQPGGDEHAAHPRPGRRQGALPAAQRRRHAGRPPAYTGQIRGLRPRRRARADARADGRGDV